MKRSLMLLTAFMVFTVSLCCCIRGVSNDDAESIDDVSTIDAVPTLESISFDPLNPNYFTGEMSVSDDSTIKMFEDYVSGYDTMCHNAEQITLDAEHYVVSNDVRIDVSVNKCNVCGNKGHIVNSRNDTTTDVWYNENLNDYYVNLSSGSTQSGWTKVSAIDLDDEFYTYVRNQLSTLDNFDKFKTVLDCIDTSSCFTSSLNGGYMITTKAGVDIVDALQPVYLEDGVITNTYIHIYSRDDGVLVKLYYVYDNAKVDQEVYSFKIKTSSKAGFYDFSIQYDNGFVPICDLQTMLNFYEENVRR